MQKYTNGIDVKYFELDVNVADWLNLHEYRLRTEEEINKHENQLDILTDIEKRQQMRPLTCYQFKRCLLEHGYKTSQVEAQILTIEDEFTRELIMLGFKEATQFVRTDESILIMQKILGLSDSKVDELWEYALML